MGRQLKNNKLKILSGSRHAKKGNKPVKEARMWKCPPHIIDHGRQLWKNVGPVLIRSGIMNELDRGCFEMLCSIYDRLLKFQEILREDGPLVDDKRGSLKKHPLSTAISQHLTLFRNFCADFGMTPASRSRLGFEIEGLDLDDDVWNNFMNKRKDRQHGDDIGKFLD